MTEIEPLSTPTLAACWAKHDRALEHIAELKGEIEHYLASEPFVITSRGYEDAHSSWIFETTEVKRLPLRPSIIIGDIVHNLRSALDHLVWQLVLFNGETPKTNNQFPIESSQAAFVKNGPRRLAGLCADHAARIEGLQPFTRTDDDVLSQARAWALELVRDLSNHDKHRLIHPVTAATGPGTEFQFGSNDDAGPLGEITFSGRIAAGVEFARIGITPVGPDPQVWLLTNEIASDIRFADSAEPVMSVVRTLRMVVADVLLSFELDIHGGDIAAERVQKLSEQHKHANEHDG
jgi:hypothetical protein